jgi:hypothetical protein
MRPLFLNLTCSMLLLIAFAATALANTITVTTLADSGPGSLREAIYSADAAPGSTIDFQSGLTGAISLKSALPAITEATDIVGPGQSALSIDSNDFNTLYCTGTTLQLSGITFGGGYYAVYIYGASAVITSCTFSLADAAGIYNSTGKVTVSYCTFTGDTTAISNETSTNISHCSFKDCNSSLENNGTAVLSRSTLFDGSVSGIMNYGNVTATNCTITENQVGVENETGATACNLVNDILYEDSDEIEDDADNVKASYCDIEDGYTGTGNISGDPDLAVLGSYGGTTETCALLPGSAALGTGVNSGFTADQRGFTIPTGGPYDIGAFQSQGFNVSITGGNNQTAQELASFTLPLSAKVSAVDSVEPVANGILDVLTPSSGASATVSATAAWIAADGTVSVTAVANGTSGSYSVTAKTQRGSASYSLTNIAQTAPALSSFSPTSGGAGAIVTLTGTNLYSVTSVQFGSVYCHFTVVSNTQISAVVPVYAASGPITVTNSVGSDSSTASFHYITTPSITCFAPASGPVYATIAIYGTNLYSVSAVSFNGVGTKFDLVTSSEITAEVPEGATAGVIKLNSPTGSATSTTSFTVQPLPTITSFTPTSGPAGTVVTVTGTGFLLTNAASFNGDYTGPTIISNNEIQITEPAGATSGPIRVLTQNGLAISPETFTVTP